MTTPNKDLEVFIRLNPHSLDAWLARQEADAVKYLKSAGDMMAMHRAQGKALFIDEMRTLLQKAKGLQQP